MNLEQKLEAILFYKNEPQSIRQLAKLLEKDEAEIKEALGNLQNSLHNRGICLIIDEKEATLATTPETKELLEKIAKDEMKAEIGKAGLETLAIILYNGPVSRREIDHIRGVNSTFILRNLSLRGLIERDAESLDQRTPKYRGTLNLLAHLGLKNISELPEFESLKKKTEEVKNQEVDS